MKLNLDNPFFNAIGKLVDCAWLSVLWVMCCIPVLTAGAATTALHYTIHKCIRGGRGYTTRTYFSAFKDNFKPATLSWLAVLLVWFVLAADIMITHQVLESGSQAGLFFYFFLIMMGLAIGWAGYVFPYIARFENTVKDTLKNGLIMEMRHLPWSLLLLVILAAGCFLAWFIPALIVLVPATVSLMFDLILERIFRKYMSPEDLQRELEKDKREDV